MRGLTSHAGLEVVVGSMFSGKSEELIRRVKRSIIARRSVQVFKPALDDRFGTAHLGGLHMDARELRAVRRVKILGCGSAYYSGIAGGHLIESIARLPAGIADSALPAAARTAPSWPRSGWSRSTSR